MSVIGVLSGTATRPLARCNCPRQHRLESPRPLRSRASLRASLARFARSVQCLLRPGSRSGRPLSFPPWRLPGSAHPCRLVRWAHPCQLVRWAHPWRLVRWAHPWRLAGSAHPWRLAGSAHPDTARDSHTPPQPIRSFAPVGAHSRIPRTIWLAAADGPSLRSGRIGGTRASARRPLRLERTHPIQYSDHCPEKKGQSRPGTSPNNWPVAADVLRQTAGVRRRRPRPACRSPRGCCRRRTRPGRSRPPPVSRGAAGCSGGRPGSPRRGR